MIAILLAAGLSVEPPPPGYDRPFPGMAVQFASPGQIRRWCGSPRAVACAYKAGDRCTILLPHGTPAGSPLYRHERAHCHGWSGRHGGRG